MKQPNILWISTHDINPDLGCYAGVWPGAEYAVTPNLDRLAAEGARFDKAFAAAPICAPARSAIMTGCFPTAIGTMHMRTKAVPPPEVRLLPEYFRAAGYWTANNVFTDFQVEVPRTVFDECSPTAHWRNRPDPDQPFFIAFHGMATHESQIYLEAEAFAAATAHVPEDARHDPAAAPVPPYYPDTPVFRRAIARYADLVTEMDHWVGGILAQLEDDGLARDTIVVFWSDHGRGMPRAKRWANEAGLREPLVVRWPGHIAPGTVVGDLVHTMDLAPTMLAAVGLPVPSHMHGEPFLRADGSVAARPNEFVFGGRDRQGEAEDTSRTVRDARYRYIRHFHHDRPAMQHNHYPDQLTTWEELRTFAFREAEQLGRGEPKSLLTPLQRTLLAPNKPAEELYDVEADPHETHNLAGDPAHAAALARLRGALESWQSRYGDLGLMDEDALNEGWRPGGRAHATAPPHVIAALDGLTASCPTVGSSLVWTVDPPTEPRERTPFEKIAGIPADDGRRWHLYTEPLRSGSVPGGSEAVWFQAWRLGFEPSPEVTASFPMARSDR
ncbi:sulfatase [Sinomonas sp. JGH33]|uniref:Sulfatase n=1 Tax=Sinomonas terricola TaxID=3110330 RepID=A0ABU5TAZ8_9MICC|nr:sulfatase [Sinomonas sp. JGH33]MEA5456626.1 sulfatase [Sinomonas sp. JGH33]